MHPMATLWCIGTTIKDKHTASKTLEIIQTLSACSGIYLQNEFDVLYCHIGKYSCRAVYWAFKLFYHSCLQIEKLLVICIGPTE